MTGEGRAKALRGGIFNGELQWRKIYKTAECVATEVVDGKPGYQVKLTTMTGQMVARSLRNHRPLILNWFRARGTISAGVVEGLNYNVKLTTRKAYGFRTFRAVEVALYHRLGNLPESELAHRFA
jgi:hypothetical protein